MQMAKYINFKFQITFHPHIIYEKKIKAMNILM